MATKNALRRLDPPISRTRERSEIGKAIDEGGIVLVEGSAGSGKSMLLEDAGQIAGTAAILVVPTIDFYETRMHSHQELEACIARALDPDGSIFDQYWTKRKADQQADLWEEFSAGYVQALGKKRALLRFDTAERLEYERDAQEVLDDCEVKEIDAPSWSWLLDRCGNLPNTTVVIAARPTSAGVLRKRLETAHQDVKVLDVAGFTLEETKEYFRRKGFDKLVDDASSDMVRKIHLLTEGRPILVALALDWLSRGLWHPTLYPIDVASLEAIEKSDGERPDEEAPLLKERLQREFEMALIEPIRRLTAPMDKAVRYAALCRKGCNQQLLAWLMGISTDTAAKLVRQMLGLSFVKPPRPGSRGMFFLHDEMYDLVEKYVWKTDWPRYERQIELDQLIIKWYEQKIERLEEAIHRKTSRSSRRTLHRERKLLITEKLYYQLDEAPVQGYEAYRQLAEEAIGSREQEWDVWLRNELLWFVGHRKSRWAAAIREPQLLNYDARRLWISRYIAERETKPRAAEEIANKLLSMPRREEEPIHYRTGVQVLRGTAQAYMGGPYIPLSLENLGKVISDLSSSPSQEADWLHLYLLGNAYLSQGLAFVNALQLESAKSANIEAIRCFQKIDSRARLAEAFNDLAYVFMRQGRVDLARNLCDRGLSIREELGEAYEIGLSFNTKGIIFERMGRPITAIEFSSRAMALFWEIGNERGTLLAAINLGRSYRRKARSPEWGKRDKDFARGSRFLHQAVDLIRDKVNNKDENLDRFYQVESYNELGCLLRDWAATILDTGNTERRVPALLDEAEWNLRHAIGLSQNFYKNAIQFMEIQEIDSMEDLAGVMYLQARQQDDPSRNLDEMEALLNDLEKRIELYSLRLPNQLELEFIRGKVHFQRARLARRLRDDALTIAQHYALAVGFVETSFSPDAPEVRKFAEETAEWLSTLPRKEAEPLIERLACVLEENNLASGRLREWIDGLLRVTLDMGWPRD